MAWLDSILKIGSSEEKKYIADQAQPEKDTDSDELSEDLPTTSKDNKRLTVKKTQVAQMQQKQKERLEKEARAINPAKLDDDYRPQARATPRTKEDILASQRGSNSSPVPKGSSSDENQLKAFELTEDQAALRAAKIFWFIFQEISRVPLAAGRSYSEQLRNTLLLTHLKELGGLELKSQVVNAIADVSPDSNEEGFVNSVSRSLAAIELRELRQLVLLLDHDLAYRQKSFVKYREEVESAETRQILGTSTLPPKLAGMRLLAGG
jgi:hypothetical protein